MSDVVLIPTWCRPEYLYLCLEHLAVACAEAGIKPEVVIMHDRHKTDSLAVTKELELAKQVFDDCKKWFETISFNVREAHSYIGNPCNFLELYKAAYANVNYRYVYLIEDDVLVTPDFFKWHQAIQERNDYFCTVGWHCIRNPEVKPSTDPTEYVDTYRDFSSIGVCWRREKLRALVQHATPNFYQNMRVYIAKNFPNAPVGPGTWTEQAGIITRLLHEDKNRLIAWPSLRRLSHVGVSGYHRPGGHKFDGLLMQRVAALRAAHQNGTINRLSKDPFDDIDQAITIPAWDVKDLHSVQTVNHAPGKY